MMASPTPEYAAKVTPVNQVNPSIDPELTAMHRVHSTLESLSPDARYRVLQWAQDFFVRGPALSMVAGKMGGLR